MYGVCVCVNIGVYGEREVLELMRFKMSLTRMST